MGDTSTLKVGEWTVTPTRCVLERAGRSVKVRPRTMQLLTYLASRAGEVVSVDELVASVWGGRVVSDGAIYQAIKELRKALKDDRGDVRFIQTVPKQGYRLVAPVTRLEAASLDEPGVVSPEAVTADSVIAIRPPGSRVRGWKYGLSAAVALMLALAVFSVRDLAEDQQEVLPNSVAVLPFKNLSPNPDDAYFAAGIHEAVLNELTKIRAMNVIAPTSVLGYADSTTPIPEIARELRVETIMEGSVQYAEGRVRISVQLIDPVTRVHLWSEDYDRAFEDIFAIQSDIATSIANALEAEFSPTERADIGKIRTVPEAYRLYLEALSLYPTSSAHPYLDRAIEIDGNFAAAYALKAQIDVRTLKGGDADPSQAAALMAVIRENAGRALEIDPDLALAHSAMGGLYSAEGDLAKAQAAYQKAMELNPNHPRILFSYPAFLRYIGDYEHALRLSERSVELGPNDGINWIQLAATQWYLRRYEEAANTFERLLEKRPESSQIQLWRAFPEVYLGNHAEARRQLRIAEQHAQERGGFAALRLGQMAFVYAQIGPPEEARRVFEMLEGLDREGRVAQAVWVFAYLAIGNHEEAYRRLQNAVSNPTGADQIALAELKANPYRHPVLEQRRWQQLRDRIGAL